MAIKQARNKRNKRNKGGTSHERGMSLINQLDGYAGVRNGLRRMAQERGDWSGCPIPVDGLTMTIEPTYKYAGIGDIGREPPDTSGAKCRNVFWSWHWHARIGVFEELDGKIWHAPVHHTNHGRFLLDTMLASFAWGIEQEAKALDLLCSLIGHTQFKMYMLTGMFLETSKASGVKYIFRRLRPTVAFSHRTPNGEGKILCCLCMHPIGYYEDTWAGCMTPTDDVVAHLMLMRADEKMFWKRCTQHPPYVPESGL